MVAYHKVKAILAKLFGRRHWHRLRRGQTQETSYQTDAVLADRCRG